MPVLFLFNKKGFTLLEVAMASFLLAVGVIGVFVLVSTITAFTSNIYSRLTAVFLAQEGIEALRNIRDSNWLEQRYTPALAWDNGILAVSSYNLDYESSAFPDGSCVGDYLKFNGNYYNCKLVTATNIQTNFKREITVSKPAANKMIVSVKVYWTSPRGTQQVTAETELYDWR